MAVIDTHCHLDLIAERGLSPVEVLQKAAQDGVDAIVQIATNLESSHNNQKLSGQKGEGTEQPDIYWTAGLHPGNAAEIDSLADIFTLIRKNRDQPDFVGIGETGLDYFHSGGSKDTEYSLNLSEQRESFERHIELAKELNLPIVLHTRDDRVYSPDKTAAIQDAFAMVRESGVRGVLHCFTYTHKEALPFVEELGWFVSYSGVLTFSNAKFVQAGAARLPLSCLLIETDAPFLAPVPHRGQVNQPAYVVHTLEFLASLRAQECSEEPQEVKQAIFENSIRFLNLKKAS